MKKIATIAIPISALLFASACSFKGPVKMGKNDPMLCGFETHELSVGNKKLEDKIIKALKQPDAGPMLFLSGGSQNGAFGAGFLNGLSETSKAHGGNGLPEYSIVTGVSTGALLSLAAFTNTADTAKDAYTIERESDLLDVYPNRGLWGVVKASTILRKGTLSDLIPMRDELDERLRVGEPNIDGNNENHSLTNTKPDWIKGISDAHAEDRFLFIVLTNIDTGHAEAFDMTAMATRINKARKAHEAHEAHKASNGGKESPHAVKARRLTKCFVDALNASSAVPMAARPVFIDNHLYIDGGSRFGVMNHMIGKQRKNILIHKSDRAAKNLDTFVIMNGDQEISKDCNICGFEIFEEDGLEKERHKSWKFLGLAERSLDILIDQVFLFSEQKIENDIDLQNYKQFAKPICKKVDAILASGGTEDSAKIEFCNLYKGELSKDDQKEVAPKNSAFLNKPKIAKIDNDMLEHPFNGETCRAWKESDKEHLKSQEFFPNYMKCLIDYGKTRAMEKDTYCKWNIADPVCKKGTNKVGAEVKPSLSTAQKSH